MQHITRPENGPWISHKIEGASGFDFVFDVLAREYTDAFSVDMARVPVGGYSPYHVDPDNHAFYIVEGTMDIVIADREYTAIKGDIVRVPKGVVHSVRNGGDIPLVMLTIYDPPRDRSALKEKARRG
jgi:mannose-6-phosphate isomerase-like protein (cupin superfamily)